MSADGSECPARTVYDALVADPALTTRRYHELIVTLRPTWIEDVVCPVNLAVVHLRAAAAAVAAGTDQAAIVEHDTARALLYEALTNARLLTVEEELQQVVVDDLLRAERRDSCPGTGRGRVVHGWKAWRRTEGF